MAERTLTDVELERHLAGDLPAGRFAQATDADRARLGELRAEHEAFLRGIDVDNEVKRIQQRVARAAPEKKVWWRWLVPAGALAAAAAAVLVFVRRGSDTPPPGEDDIQVKGDEITLVIHVAGDDGSRRVATGDTVQTGDRLRFEINAAKPGYIALFGVDGSGTLTVYYPESGNEPLAFDPRAARILPGAIQLDETPGDEHYYAVYSRQHFELATIQGLVKANGPLPPGVMKAEAVLHKKLPP